MAPVKSNSSDCPLQHLRKEMFDVTVRVGADVLAAGSFAALSGLKGMPKNASLVIAGSLNLVDSVARGLFLFCFFFLLFVCASACVNKL